MKFLLAVCISMFATAAMACTDFTGKYRDDDMDVYTIEQSGCEQVTYVEDDGDRETFIIDGQYRVTDEEDGVRILTAGNFVDATLVFDSKIEYLQPLPPEVPETSIPRTTKLVYSLDASGNLVGTVTVYNSAGTVLATASQTHPKV